MVSALTAGDTKFQKYAHDLAEKNHFIPESKAHARQYFAYNWESLIVGYGLETRGPVLCNNIQSVIKYVAVTYYRKNHPSLIQRLLNFVFKKSPT